MQAQLMVIKGKNVKPKSFIYIGNTNTKLVCSAHICV